MAGWTTLVQPDILALALSRGDLAVVDCRFSLADPAAGEQAWRRSHLPGAVYAHLERDLSDMSRTGEGRHPWPQCDVFLQRLQQWGIGPSTQVVAYDDGDGAIAARLWFLLRVLGHEKVAVLDGGLSRYPGSPLIARHLLRRQDRLSAAELHPEDAERLKILFEGDFQVRVMALDGWLAFGAHLPPKEKRGLVLVDPPFEEEGEFDRIVGGLAKACKRWPGGIYALWYPIKNRKAVAAFREALRETGIPKLLDIVFEIRPSSSEPSLDGTGMVVVNPPFTLEEELRALLPVLHRALAAERSARWTMDWLAGESA